MLCIRPSIHSSYTGFMAGRFFLLKDSICQHHNSCNKFFRVKHRTRWRVYSSFRRVIFVAGFVLFGLRDLRTSRRTIRVQVLCFGINHSRKRILQWTLEVILLDFWFTRFLCCQERVMFPSVKVYQRIVYQLEQEDNLCGNKNYLHDHGNSRTNNGRIFPSL